MIPFWRYNFIPENQHGTPKIGGWKMIFPFNHVSFGGCWYLWVIQPPPSHMSPGALATFGNLGRWDVPWRWKKVAPVSVSQNKWFQAYKTHSFWVILRFKILVTLYPFFLSNFSLILGRWCVLFVKWHLFSELFAFVGCYLFILVFWYKDFPFLVGHAK